MMDDKPHPAIVIFARMEIALQRGRGIRLSNDELYTLSTSLLGQIMADAKDWATSSAPEAVERPKVEPEVVS